MNVSLGIDSIDASCVLGLYENSIIVSVKFRLFPKTNVVKVSRFFLVFSSCPSVAAIVPPRPPPSFCTL